MGRSRRHHAALWLCVDNSSEADSFTRERLQESNSFKCQEPGMSLRVRHLRTCHSDAPSAKATAAIFGQRASEKISGFRVVLPMDDITRDRSSPCQGASIPLRTNSPLRKLGMVANARNYRTAMARRMRAAREDAGLSQADMASALQLNTIEQYKKMEQRGALPPWLIEPFALLVGKETLYILLGRHEPAVTATKRVRRVKATRPAA